MVVTGDLTGPPAQPVTGDPLTRRGRAWMSWFTELDPLRRTMDVFVVGPVPLAALWALTAAWNQLSAGRIALGMTAALVQTIALCGYRRWPATVMVVTAVAQIVSDLLVAQGFLLLGTLMATYGVAAWGGLAQRVIGFATALAVLGTRVVETAVVSPAGGPGLLDRWWFVELVFFSLAFFGFGLTGRVEAVQRNKISELHARSTKLERERALAEQRAAERERALLARELHDILNHSVTAMVLDAQAGAETGDCEAARATLHRVANTGRNALVELRRLLGVLRASPDGQRPSHNPVAPPPTLDQIDQLVESLPEGGPRVTVERHGTVRPLDTSVEFAGYRVVQESLTNVVKHAGPVDVVVRLTYLPDALEIVVRNSRPPENGRRRPRGAGMGTGLIGMQERVGLLGGALNAGPAEDGGFTVYATMPSGRIE